MMILFSQAVQKFLDYLSNISQASPHTIRNYAIDLNLFQKYLENALPDSKKSESLHLNVIGRQEIRNFLAHLSKEHSKKTIVRRLSAIRKFFKFSFEQHFIQNNPAEALETPKINKNIPNVLSSAQIAHFFNLPDITTYLGLRDRVIMELFYSSGMRIGELVQINKEDFDQKTLLIKLKGKGRKERIVPITKNAATWVSAYLAHPERQDSEAIFLNRFGKRLSARSIDRHFTAYLKQSGFTGRLTPHTLRHSIATHWLENGMDLKTIQEILGHSTLSATTIYTKVSTNLKQKVYKEAHPRA